MSDTLAQSRQAFVKAALRENSTDALFEIRRLLEDLQEGFGPDCPEGRIVREATRSFVEGLALVDLDDLEW